MTLAGRWKGLGAGTLRRLLSGVTWSTFGTVFNQGSTFVVNVLAAHALGRSVFGEYAVVQNSVSALALVAQLAMSYTATKFLAELRTTAPERAARIFALSGLLAGTSAVLASAGFLVASSWLATTVYHAPGLSHALAIAAALILMTVLNTFMVGALAGLEAFKATGATGIITGSFYVLLCVAGMRAAGLEGLVAGMAGSGLLQAFLLAQVLKRECRRQNVRWMMTGLWEERGALIHFALPAALAGLSQMGAAWLATTILARQENGFLHVAAFAAANTFGIVVLIIPNLLNGVSMPLLNNARGRGDAQGVRDVFWSTAQLNVAITVSGAAACALAGPHLMNIFGREFSGTQDVLYLILASTVPSALWYTSAQLIGSHGSMWPVLAFGVLPRDVILIATAVALTPRIGARGLAAAVALAWTLGLVAMSPACLASLSRSLSGGARPRGRV